MEPYSTLTGLLCFDIELMSLQCIHEIAPYGTSGRGVVWIKSVLCLDCQILSRMVISAVSSWREQC